MKRMAATLAYWASELSKARNLRHVLDDRTGHFFEPRTFLPEQLYKGFLFDPPYTLIAFTSFTFS